MFKTIPKTLPVFLTVFNFSPLLAQTTPPPTTKNTGEVILLANEIVVNSNEDVIKPDDKLTLREAIEIINLTLPLSQLTELERKQIKNLTPFSNEQQINLSLATGISFNLPNNQTTIQLKEQLPALLKPVIIDGTTQPGYNERTSSSTSSNCQTTKAPKTNNQDFLSIPKPIVTLTPAPEKQVLRGLTIVSADVTVRGLNFSGFNSQYQTRETPVSSLLPADILIIQNPPPETINQTSKNNSGNPPQIPNNIFIEKNWLGNPNTPKNQPLSAFGVVIFEGKNITIRDNQISNHTGSGILTGSIAENTQIINNVIEKNGFSGMPNAIHLEGNINNSGLYGNLICNNAGSAIFFFKTQGATEIKHNEITSNGLKNPQAAIYLMGVGHKILENLISNQNGPGIVIAAYPESYRNNINGNVFSNLEGLSIDLTNQTNSSVRAYLLGDGPNPMRNSYYRREETGNGAVNAPEFLAQNFIKIGEKVNIDGKADPGTTIEIYRVSNPEKNNDYGPLNELITTVKADEEGRFGITLKTLKAGDTISAIATDKQFGTSEPARNAVIKTP